MKYDGIEIRPLEEKDMARFVEIVKQLSPQSSLGSLTERSAYYDLTRLQPKMIFVAVIDGEVVGTASLLIEEKINRGTSKSGRLRTVGHVEEVVVDEACRHKGVGKALMDYCVEAAKVANAYKVILDCSEDNVKFYENCGFSRYEVCMRIDV